MSITEDSRVVDNPGEFSLTTAADRRADVERKHGEIAALLREVRCDGMLILETENVAWLTSGGSTRSVFDPGSQAAIYFNQEGRWILASNSDSQRIFDEEIDGLGFQLKEWPWHWGRTQMLTDLCQGRKVACDRSFVQCQVVSEQLQQRRRIMTTYDQACLRALGQIVSHALEATGRTMRRGESEREIAGQLSHRLLHRGVYPVALSVAADGRGRNYRQSGFTSMPIRNNCVLTVLGRKYGLCVMASRSICFAQPDNAFKKEHDTASRVSATYVAGSWPDSIPEQILATGRRVYQVCDAEYEWLANSQGHVTGRSPVELALDTQTEELFHSGWVVTWNASCGAAVSCDTFLITEDGPRVLTPTENWPLKRIRVQGAEFVRPDILVRE